MTDKRPDTGDPSATQNGPQYVQRGVQTPHPRGGRTVLARGAGLLRREGLYYSHLSKWRAEREALNRPISLYILFGENLYTDHVN